MATTMAAKFPKAFELHQRGKIAEAQTLYAEILRRDPRNFDAMHYLGVIAMQSGDPGFAVSLINQALKVNERSAAAYCNLGSAHRILKQFTEALKSYGRALELEPASVDALYQQGNVFFDLRQWESALESFDRAIAIRPEGAEVHLNRAMALRELMRCPEALASCDRAIALRDAFAEAHVSRGAILFELEQWDAALACYERAIAVRPEYAEAYTNRAIVHLLRGDWESGWADYEWRWKHRDTSTIAQPRTFAGYRWSGSEAISQKTLLLHSEQGLGDTLQFCRYVKLAAAMGARVVLEVQKPLVSILADLEGVSQLVARGSTLPPFDFHCPLLSLPLAFKTRLASIPAPPAYLRADNDKVSGWGDTLEQSGRPLVGLAWSGSATNINDGRRSVPLEHWIEHLPAGIQFVSLQKEVRAADEKVLRESPLILNAADDLLDFSDTAALCARLDLVISVDTSVAHLSGALGIRTWVLLPRVPDWRWLLERDDSPWYPSMKLYRQRTACDWKEVLERVGADLMQLFNL